MEDVIPHRERTFDQLRESGVVRWWKVLGFSIWCCTQSAVNGCTFQMQMNEDVSDPVSISSSAEIIAECNTWQLKEDDTIITDTEAWYADDPVAVLLPQALDSGGRIILSLEFMVNQLTPRPISILRQSGTSYSVSYRSVIIIKMSRGHSVFCTQVQTSRCRHKMRCSSHSDQVKDGVT